MHRGVHINDLILLIKSEYFIAIFVLKQWPTIINLPKAAKKAIKSQHILTSRKPIQHNIIKQSHCSVSHKALDYLGKLDDKM